MYKSEFDNTLRQNKTYNAYMFFGQSTFLIENYTSIVASNHGSNDEIEKIYFDDYNFKYCHDKLLQSSLFSSNNILIIKIEKKLPKKEVSALINACNINPDSVVIFACIGDADFRAMSGYFSEKTKSVSVRIFAPNPYESTKILEEEAIKSGLRYDTTALNHLYFMHRQDLALTVNDFKKLSILNEQISAKVIDQHCFGIGAVSIEDFLHNLLQGLDIREDINALLEEGLNEIYLLNQISAFIQQLFMISSYTRINGVANAKEILGFAPPKAIWDKKAKLAIAIKPQLFLKMFDYLNNLELEMKSGKISNQNIYLQSCLIKFSVLFR